MRLGRIPRDRVSGAVLLEGTTPQPHHGPHPPDRFHHCSARCHLQRWPVDCICGEPDCREPASLRFLSGQASVSHLLSTADQRSLSRHRRCPHRHPSPHRGGQGPALRERGRGSGNLLVHSQFLLLLHTYGGRGSILQRLEHPAPKNTHPKPSTAVG